MRLEDTIVLVTLDRRNALVVAELFDQDAGRFVAVSASDTPEGIMAAQGSGAVALSRAGGAVMNIDIGGGTTKVILCRDGDAEETTAGLEMTMPESAFRQAEHR